MVVQSKVRKWGNSLGIRLQKPIVEQLRFQDGSDIDIKVSGKKMIVTLSAPKYSLKSLMEKVNEENIHHETKTGSPVRTEIW